MIVLKQVKSVLEFMVKRIHWITSKHEVYAVNDLDFKDLTLDSDLCIFCGSTIDKDNFGGLIMSEGQLSAYCNDGSCNPIANKERSHESR